MSVHAPRIREDSEDELASLVSSFEQLQVSPSHSTEDDADWNPAQFRATSRDELFQGLSEALEDKLPRTERGDRAYSEYVLNSWRPGLYAIPGFARKYVSKKFELRCGVVYHLLEELFRSVAFEMPSVEILDVGCGPGCGAVGAAKFLVDNGCNVPCTTLMDPVMAWAPIQQVLREKGLRTFFKQAAMASIGKYLQRHTSGELVLQTPLLVIVSHVLKDFGGDPEAVSHWWRQLFTAPGRPVIVLVVERSDCSSLLPGVPSSLRSSRISLAVDGSEGSKSASVLLWPSTYWGSERVAELPSRVIRPSTSGPPRCPRCRTPMTLRTNRNGYNPGTRFWGCSAFPQCRETRPA
eukprot:TRINITY_DN94552_c0_g1_i1.p1 TRINITY_DN94552_c0_g1~~TRINITY_DN94552_c0_g1_i1.p1  ORF type:complete len:351 (+),score=39.55 TRINITY_DN94552_c0_g1_i1:120-1172(+)